MKQSEMSNRERNKAYNRTKILTAARALLKEGGLDALSMRTLAEQAQVSSRTPYNLFGSKTDVLLALLDEPLQRLWESLPVPSAQSLLGTVLGVADRAYAIYAEEIEYYRNIFWGVMTSDHHATRCAAMQRAEQITTGLLAQALARGELAEDTELAALGRHITLMLAGLLGLWGNALISAPELLAQLKASLVHTLLCHCSATLRAELQEIVLRA